MTEETLFHAALAKSPAERAAFLEAACVGQPQLRAAVEALLAAHEASGSLLDKPPRDLAESSDSDPGAGKQDATSDHTPQPAAAPPHPDVRTADYRPDFEPGVVIAGRYVLRQKIGEGGMGEVWVAKQTEPVKRKVALKLIKTGMDSKAVLARFEQERQALAMMDHPNIARVLDGGMTPTGQPFFVMELVNGLPLNKFCDEARLTPKERLELFVPICQAVQHAHQKGIVHRDLKPSNILVTLIDGMPVPKVIDFGLAKATAGRLADASLSTHFGAVVGTLEYMSPEQAGPSSEDIDTRADIYSLGVILYELLTGLRPIDAKRLQNAAITEMIRIIQEEEPSKPSTRLSTDESLPSLAALRQIEPKKLMALLRGELDWVVMKCLEKRRDRRDETANGLARDVQRYLADEVVEARPPSASYRLSKFLNRNKGPVMAASLILLALLAGIAGTTWGLFEARRQEQMARGETAEKEKARQAESERAEGERLAKLDAEARQAEAERQKSRAEAGEKLASERLAQVATAKKKAEEEKKKAEDEKQIAQSVRNFLQNRLLAQADLRTQIDTLSWTGGLAAEAKENPTIRELLDRAAKELAPERIDSNFSDQPLIQAEILRTVGSTYNAVGEYERAIGLLERSATLYRQHLGPEHPRALTSTNDLAAAYIHLGKLDLALPLCAETLKLHKATLGPDHRETLGSMNNLAAAYRAAGKLDLALPLYKETLDLRKATLGPDDPDTLASMNNLAGAYEITGKLDLALPLFAETLKLRKKKLGPEHPDTLASMGLLAHAYWESGNLDLAVPLYKETLQLQKATLGPEHPDTLIIMGNLAAAYQAAGKLDLALPLYKETLDLRKKKLGPEHPNTLTIMNNLANAYEAAGNLDLALPLFTETLTLRTAKLGPDHPDTLTTMGFLGHAYWKSGRLDLALPLFAESLTGLKAKLGPEHPNTLTSMNNLATAYQDAGKMDLALPLFAETLKLRKATLGPDHPSTLTSMNNLAVAYWTAKQLDKSIPLFEDTLTRRQTVLGRQHPDTLQTAVNLGVNYRDAGRLAEALPLIEVNLKLQKATLGPGHPDTLNSMNNLAGAYQAAGKLDLVLPLLEEILKLRKANRGADHPDTLASMAILANAYREFGKLDLALPLLKETLKLMNEKLGPEHLNTLTNMNNLAVAYQAAGKQDLALPLFEKVYRAAKKYPRLHGAGKALLEAYAQTGKTEQAITLAKELLADARTQLPKESPQLATQLASIGAAFLQANDSAEAEPILRECLAIREKTQPGEWSTFNTRAMLGGVLLGQKKYAAAEPLLLAGYEGMKQREAKIPSTRKPRLTEALERLVQVYEALEKTDEAAKWRKELVARKEATERPKLDSPRPATSPGTQGK